MGVGSPVICSTSPQSDAKLIVEEAKCGLWVPAGSPEALAEAILELSADPVRAEDAVTFQKPLFLFFLL